MTKYKIIPIFVPHKGCPHQCSFCNQKYITGQIEEMTPQKAESVINLYLSTIDTERFQTEIAFYGGSFTATDISYQKSLLEVAYSYVQKGYIKGIRLSTRPDCITNEILDNLKNYGVTEIELGVQSMCSDVLNANNRGHTADDVKNAVCLIRKYNFKLGLQQMTGLFMDSDEKDIYTSEQICLLKPDFVRVYPTLVFNNTDLADYYNKGIYNPPTVEQAVALCKK
ncbi:MAG: radical SAM protein, partial [Clostridia bacterium]|nr:radical SAM protein [Clostridia bacterium]